MSEAQLFALEEQSSFGDEHATTKKHLKISFNPNAGAKSRVVYAQSAWTRIAGETGTAGRAWIKASSTLNTENVCPETPASASVMIS
jgi:hypothetical protein